MMHQPRIVPLYDNVVIKAEEAEKQTEGGIFIPDTADKERKQIGVVTAVGPGKVLRNGERGHMEVKVGDRVVYGTYVGNDVKVGETEYKIIGEGDILAVLR